MSERLYIRDNRNGNWFFIHNDLIKRFGSQIGAYGIAVYNVLAMYANNETQEAYPSYATIADHIGCSRRQVMKVIDLLIERNIITKTIRQEDSGLHDSNILVLLHKDLWGSEPHSLPEVVNHIHYPTCSEQSSPPLVNDVHQGGEPGSPKQDLKNKTKRKDYAPPKKGAKDFTKSEIPSGNLPTSNPDDLATAIAALCKLDPALVSNGKREQIKAAATKLYFKQASPGEVGEFGAWWRVSDWRGQKGSPPTPDQVLDEWERFRGAKLNGRPTAKLTPEQLEAYKRMEAR